LDKLGVSSDELVWLLLVSMDMNWTGDFVLQVFYTLGGKPFTVEL
jgi:hypothetical protein